MTTAINGKFTVKNIPSYVLNMHKLAGEYISFSYISFLYFFLSKIKELKKEKRKD